MRMSRTTARWFQLFYYRNDNLVNEKGAVVSIKDKTDAERQNIEASKKTNGLHQQWDIIYVDEMPPEPKKGELNKRFNMHVDRPFFVVTGLKSERYLDIIKHNVVLKTPNGFPSQKWYFDQKTKTIKSTRDKQSWSLESNGKSENL